MGLKGIFMDQKQGSFKIVKRIHPLPLCQGTDLFVGRPSGTDAANPPGCRNRRWEKDEDPKKDGTF